MRRRTRAARRGAVAAAAARHPEGAGLHPENGPDQVTSESVYESRNAGLRPARGMGWIFAGWRRAADGPAFATLASGHAPFSRSSVSPERRRALVLLVNSAVAVIGGALSALLGVFALKPAAAATRDRWIRAGALERPRGGRAGGPRARRAASRRLVPGARAADGLPGLGRREAGAGDVGHLHPSRLSGPAGTPRRSTSSARATAACTTPRARCWRARRRVRSTASTRASTAGTMRCWCGCDRAG